MTDGAAVLLIDILRGCGAGLGPWLLTAICCRSLLLLLGHKEAQCRAEEAEWSSQAAGPHSPSQRARQPQLTFPPSNGLRSPGGPQVRSNRPRHTERQRGREEWRGDIVPFPSAQLLLTSLNFGLFCWENNSIKKLNWLSLYVFLDYYCFLSIHDGSAWCCFWGTGNHKNYNGSLNLSLANGQPIKPLIAKHTELQGDTK